MIISEIISELQEAAFNGLLRGESALSSALGRTARDSKGRLPWNALWPGCGGGAPARRYSDYLFYGVYVTLCRPVRAQ